MSNPQAEIITQAINDLRKQNLNEVEIAIDLLGGVIVPVLIEASGTATTANYLHNLADMIYVSDLDNIN